MRTEHIQHRDQEALTVGGTLQAARESLGLSIRDMAEVTRIQGVWLECIEQDRYSEMPAEVFIRGFIRSYARELRLDEDVLFDAYLAQTGQFRTVESAPAREPEGTHRMAMAHLTPRSSSLRYIYGAAAVALVALIAGVILAMSTGIKPDAAATNFRVNDTTNAWQPSFDNASDWRRE